jgi:hypothetical protein
MTASCTRTSMMSELETRVRGEYDEMPGQRLTLVQAARLWGVDVTVGAALLNRLVASGFLRQVGPYYFRADLGRPTA